MNTGSATHLIERRVGRHLAIGALRWEILPDIHADYRVELKQAAARHEAQFGVISEPKKARGKMSVGFLPPEVLREARQGYSAGLWLAACVKQPTLYFEQMPSGRYWVVSIDEHGELDQRTDVLLASNDAGDLIDHILDESRHSDTPPRVVHGTPQLPLTNMLERARREQATFESLLTEPPPAEARITQLVGLKPIAYVGIVAGVLMVIAGAAGWQYYQAQVEAAELEAARQAAIAQQIEARRLATLTQIRIAEAVKRAIDEDTRTASPVAVIDGCLDVYRTLGRELAGWRIEAFECAPSGNEVRVSLSAAPIRAGAVLGADNARLFAASRARGWEPSVDSAANRATLTLPRPAPAPRPGLTVDSLPLAVALQEYVIPRFQRLGALGRDFAPRFENPTERPITYLDPALEQDTGNPARFKPVPPEYGYRQGKLVISGDDARTLKDIALGEPIFTLTALRLEPTSLSRAKFVMEATYVLSRS